MARVLHRSCHFRRALHETRTDGKSGISQISLLRIQIFGTRQICMKDFVMEIDFCLPKHSPMMVQ